MKPPSIASQKKVTAENLERLGAERLAEILAQVAQARPDLKRRLRMELAAEQGADHLAIEIDKRLASLETSRSRVSWRQRAAFVRDLDGLRALIVERMASLDAAAALDRLWRFMAVAGPVSLRMRDRDGALAAVFEHAARNIGAILAGADAERAGEALGQAVAGYPRGWADWLPAVLEQIRPESAHAALRRLSETPGATPGWLPIVRQLADAAGDVDAFRSTFTTATLRTPSVAAEVAQRLLAANRIEEAGRLLGEAGGAGSSRSRPVTSSRAEPDYEWETAWIEYLERSGEPEAAQAARWASFERTLSAERAKAFVTRLTGFDDVEAENRAFDHAARHPDFEQALQFLMEWPALLEAARMIQARSDDIQASPEKAELWAARLRSRHPVAAHLLLRRAAAAAFHSRDLATCDRLTQEADAIEL